MQKVRGVKRNASQLHTALVEKVVTEGSTLRETKRSNASKPLGQLLRIPASECALMHLPGKPWDKLQMIPRSTIVQLTEQDLTEELQDRSFSFHAGVDTAVAVQCLLAAMEPSWNQNTVIEKHYPEHLDLPVSYTHLTLPTKRIV